MKTEITEKEKEWIVKETAGKMNATIHIPKELCKTREEVVEYIKGRKDL